MSLSKASVPRFRETRFLHGFLLARGRGPDADRAEARADLARPGEEGAEDRGGNVLGERPELLVPEDVAVRVGIGEEDVVPHARVARHGEDRVAGLVRLGPSSQMYPFSFFVVMLPPTRSLASVTSIRTPGEDLPSVNAVDEPDTPAP